MITKPSGISRARANPRAKRAQSGKAARSSLSGPEARRLAPALRLPPRAQRHADELGGAHGPSHNPSDKRLAVHVEDHPVEYGNFEGTIPDSEYGGGTVMLWDPGSWEPQDGSTSRRARKGKLAFLLHGQRLNGEWALVRLRTAGETDKDNWLLIKDRRLRPPRRQAGHRARDQKRQVRPLRWRDRGRQEGQKQVWHSNKPAKWPSRMQIERPRRRSDHPGAARRAEESQSRGHASRQDKGSKKNLRRRGRAPRVRRAAARNPGR